MTAEPETSGAATAIAPASRLPVWVAWATGAGLIVVAWFVALATPGEEQAQAPFPVAAVVGEPATGRTLTAKITDLRRAAEVSASNGWTADGNWLVVDLEAAAVVSEAGGSIGHAMLRVQACGTARVIARIFSWISRWPSVCHDREPRVRTAGWTGRGRRNPRARDGLH